MKKIILVALAAVMLQACSNYKVTEPYDGFSKNESCEMAYADPINQQRCNIDLNNQGG